MTNDCKIHEKSIQNKEIIYCNCNQRWQMWLMGKTIFNQKAINTQ